MSSAWRVRQSNTANRPTDEVKCNEFAHRIISMMEGYTPAECLLALGGCLILVSMEAGIGLHDLKGNNRKAMDQPRAAIT